MAWVQSFTGGIGLHAPGPATDGPWACRAGAPRRRALALGAAGVGYIVSTDWPERVHADDGRRCGLLLGLGWRGGGQGGPEAHAGLALRAPGWPPYRSATCIPRAMSTWG
eukprot:scaffold3050_cov362-Prasinococcus_capsulatus_cf.AAC.3